MNVQTVKHAVGLGKNTTPNAGSNNTLVRLGVSVSGRLGLTVGKSGATDIPVTPLGTKGNSVKIIVDANTVVVVYPALSDPVIQIENPVDRALVLLDITSVDKMIEALNKAREHFNATKELRQ